MALLLFTSLNMLNVIHKLIRIFCKNAFSVLFNEGGSKVSFRTIHGHVKDKLFETPLLIHLHWFEMDQKWVFDQFESGSKVGFRTNWVTWSLISKRNWKRIKSESVCICFTWLSSSTYFIGLKVGPPRSIKWFQLQLEFAGNQLGATKSDVRSDYNSKERIVLK